MEANINILFLEDDPAGVRLLTRKLQTAGPQYTIFNARNKAMYLENLLQRRYDCIILDYTLPDIEGLEAIKIAKQNVPDVPIIVFTGSVGEEKAIECMKAGAYDFILKTNTTRLIPAIISAIEYKRSQDARIAAEKALQKAHRDLQEILERITDGFFALDINWNFTYVNRRGAQLLGREPQELIGKNIWSLFPSAADQPFLEKFQVAMTEQKRIFTEDFNRPWNRWFETRIYPSPEGLSIFFTDVTDRKHHVEQKTK